MVSKLLFVFGIVLAHGAVAASLIHDQPSRDRDMSFSCANPPAPDPYFAPQRELVAMIVVPPSAKDPLSP